MEVRRFTPDLASPYQDFLFGFEGALLYYSLQYKAFLEDLLGCRANYWLALEDGAIIGVLPLMERYGPWGRVLNSLPYYGSHGGVLGTTEAARAALYAKYDALAGAPGVLAATLVENPLLPVRREPPVAHDLKDERISQVTLLSGEGCSANYLMARIAGAARRNVRKAEKSGVSVRIDNDAMGFLEEVHRQNMAEVGGKAKSPDFFAKLPNHFRAGEDYNIYVADIAGGRAAALLIFYFNSTVEYFTPVTKPEHRSSQPMALILYRAMQDAAARGCTCWNWGGTWLSQQGVYRFKRKWGAEDRRYRYFVKVNDEGVLHRSSGELLSAYPDFYVVPFEALDRAEETVR